MEVISWWTWDERRSMKEVGRTEEEWWVIDVLT